jgi:hypothetical protein
MVRRVRHAQLCNTSDKVSLRCHDDHAKLTASTMNYVQARAGEGGQGDEGVHFMEELLASLHVHEAVSPIYMSSSCHTE